MDTTNAPTLYEIGKQIPKRREDGRRPRSDAKTTAKSIMDGITPVPFKNEVGLRVVNPDELASLRVPMLVIEKNSLDGFQRSLNDLHAHRISLAIKKGKEIPTAEVSLDEYGNAFMTDGQHRAIGAILADRPLRVVVTQRTDAQMKQLFEDQGKAKKLTASHVVLTATDKMSEYVQDALTNENHPWADLVSVGKNSKLTPSAMFRCISRYGCDVVGTIPPAYIEQIEKKFDSKRADELAELISCFGTKESNPLAFQAVNLGAIVETAIHVMLRADNVKPKQDRDRWMKHMPEFPFGNFAYVKSRTAMRNLLIDHWNKNMSARRVEVRIYENSTSPGRVNPSSKA